VSSSSYDIAREEKKKEIKKEETSVATDTFYEGGQSLLGPLKLANSLRAICESWDQLRSII